MKVASVDESVSKGWSEVPGVESGIGDEVDRGTVSVSVSKEVIDVVEVAVGARLITSVALDEVVRSLVEDVVVIVETELSVVVGTSALPDVVTGSAFRRSLTSGALGVNMSVTFCALSRSRLSASNILARPAGVAG